MTEQQIAAMRQALEALKKYHYYTIDAGLPNQSMLNEGFTAITALTAALADQALDKMAENAREIGLDYEPVALNREYAQRLIEALHENGDPVSVDAAEEFERLLTQTQARDCKECPCKKLIPLTDDEIMAIGRELGLKCRFGGNPNIDFDYARAIEAKLREKNNG